MTNQNKLLDENFECMSFSKVKTKCIFCDCEYDLSFKLNQNKNKIDSLRKHLVLDHFFIISDINEIHDINGYLHYWRKKITNNCSLKSICAIIKTNTKPEDEGESIEYSMLCPDILPEDKKLREELKLLKLNYLVKIQEQERNQNDFERKCFFCNLIIKGNKVDFLNHLKEKHNLNLGNENNIVFVTEFLDLIEQKLNKKICLYCGYVFKDWITLKEHMRKKLHKRLHPSNKEYDEFYLTNYLKNNSNLNDEKKYETDDEKDENWDDWVIDQDCEYIFCIFCNVKNLKSLENFTDHLLKEHCFDFNILNNYSFYKKIKIINFLRSKTKNLECFDCNIKFSSLELYNQHLFEKKHNFPQENNWDLPQFYKPIIENDLLLRLIDVNLNDDDNLNDEFESKIIISE